MNSPYDEKSFDEYLQRGSAVSTQYRAMDSDEVPAELDASILARASSEVNSRKARAWRRWSVPVALAASAVLAVSIVLQIGVQEDFSTLTSMQNATEDSRPALPSFVPEEPVLKESSPVEEAFLAEEKVSSLELDPAPALGPGHSAQTARQEEVAESAAAFARAHIDEQAAPPPAVSVPELYPAAAEAARDEEAERSPNAIAQTAAKERPDLARTQVTSARRAVMAPPVAPLESEAAETRVTGVRDSSANLSGSVAGPAGPVETSDPAKWLRKIRELRETGKVDEADREWRSFREAYPDYAVAADDRAQPR